MSDDPKSDTMQTQTPEERLIKAINNSDDNDGWAIGYPAAEYYEIPDLTGVLINSNGGGSSYIPKSDCLRVAREIENYTEPEPKFEEEDFEDPEEYKYHLLQNCGESYAEWFWRMTGAPDDAIRRHDDAEEIAALREEHPDWFRSAPVTN